MFTPWGRKRSVETTIKCDKCNSIMIVGKT